MEELYKPIDIPKIPDLDEDVFSSINREIDVNALACQSCGTCTSSCPVSFAMDYSPRQILRFIQFGFLDKVFKGNTIWVCAQCYTCQERCPRGIKLTEIIADLRRKAIKDYEEITKRNPSSKFFSIFLENLKKNGRLNEVSFFMNFQRKTNGIPGLIGYIPFGLELFKKGKVNFKTHRIQQLKQFEDAFQMVQKLES
jgi:heterodisulfide reductase subunit C